MSNLANQPMGTPQQSDGGHVPPPPPQYDYVVTKSPAGDQVPPVQAPTAHYPALSPTQHPAAAEGRCQHGCMLDVKMALYTIRIT